MVEQSLKQRIVETALDLFRSKGYHGVTVNEIVETAGTSKGGFYHIFKSKDALLFEIHDVFISHVITASKQARDQHEEPLDQLWAMLHAFTHVFDVYQRHITVFYDESAYLPDELKDTIKDKRTAYRHLIEQVLEDGQQRGQFRPEISVTITTMAIIGMVNWTYKWYRQNGPLTMAQITVQFNDLILRGILTEQGSEHANNKQYFIKTV